jgi:hypothetical protein
MSMESIITPAIDIRMIPCSILIILPLLILCVLWRPDCQCVTKFSRDRSRVDNESDSTPQFTFLGSFYTLNRP